MVLDNPSQCENRGNVSNMGTAMTSEQTMAVTLEEGGRS